MCVRVLPEIRLMASSVSFAPNLIPTSLRTPVVALPHIQA